VKTCLAGVLLTVSLIVSPFVMASTWSVSVSEQGGLPVLTNNGGTAMTASYGFWSTNWKWADQQTEFKVIAPFDYSVVGRNQTLNLDLAARISRPTTRRLVWTFDLDSHSASADVVGGGMVFNFDLGNFSASMGEPELLPNNRGWSWGHAGQARIEMRFDPPLAAVYFERGMKSEIRAFFYQGSVPVGRRRHVATVDVSGDIQTEPTVNERFGLPDFTTWQTDIIGWKVSPIDLTFLNEAEKPAGRRGFVGAVKDKLMFEDGTRARFWGTNLTAYALYGTSKENVKQQAHRLSALGFNLVRLHHHDSPWVNPNVFGDQKGMDTQNLSSAMLDKLDWWIKCLKDEGIYVWLDLHVQRALKPGDQIEGFDEIRKGQPTVDLKGYNYVNTSIQRAMQRFDETYVNHRNNYTGLRYKDEPAIAAMLITNENDVTYHFGNSMLPDKNVPRHNALYMNQANAFAETWGLPKDKTWRAWEHGPSKIFLNDLERRFNVEVIAYLRAQGVRVPIVTTSFWGSEPLSSLPALTVGDLIDVHSYGGMGELERNPLHAANLVHWIAAAHIADKPLTVTEWNVESFPSPDRHAIPLYIAGSASMQGWDAMMQYAYSQTPLNDQGSPSNWHAFNDPALIAMMPAAALLYRQGHVQEATSTYVFAPSREQLFYQLISPANSIALRTAAEKGKLLIAMPQSRELPWLSKSNIPGSAKIITDSNRSLIAAGAPEAVSDTGELRRNWEKGIYTINTPLTQAAMGWIGGQTITLRNLEVAATTKNATVAVQSLDGKPVGTSSRLMISLGARAVLKSGEMPFYSEPVEGNLSLAAVQGLKLYKKLASTGDLRQIPAPYSNGRYSITLDKSLGTYWLFLR
jgi:hypothetical protein